MILEFFFSILFGLVKMILSILPDIPNVPENIQDMADYVIELIAETVGVIAYLYTPTLFIFIFTMLIILINFDTLYRLVMWIARKIPSLHIS